MTLPRLMLVLVLLLLPGMAAAHGDLAGGSGFYSGAAHPFLAIEQFLSLLVLGLLLGSASGPNARLPLLFLATTLCVGLAVGPTIGQAEPLMLGLALLLGCTLAAAVRVPVWGMSIAAALAGWIVGMGTDVLVPSPPDLVAWFAPFSGVVVGVFLIVLNAAALSSVVKTPAGLIAMRILGSWIAAIALMVLALRLRAVVVTG